MDPDSRPDAFDAPDQSSANPPSPAATLVPTLAVLAVAVAALAAAIMSTRTKPPAIDYRAAATPAPKQEVVRAPPLNRMGSSSGCQTCGVVESVRASKATKGFEMRIRMDDGSLRTVEQRGAMAAGTRVVVDGATVKLMPGPG